MNKPVTLESLARKNKKQDALIIYSLLQDQGSNGETISQQVTNIENTVNVLSPPMSGPPGVVYVDLDEGDDAAALAELGSPPWPQQQNRPFKNVSTALAYIGDPTNAEEFEAPFIVHVKGQPGAQYVDEQGPSLRLPNRRISFVLSEGIWLFTNFVAILNDAMKFGSAVSWHYAFFGSSGIAPIGEPAGNVNGLFSRIGDGTAFLSLVQNAPAGSKLVEIVLARGLAVHGTILHSDDFVANDIQLTYINAQQIQGRMGPTIVGSAGKITLALAQNALFNSAADFKGHCVANVIDSVCAGDFNVAAAPDLIPGARGFVNCHIDPLVTWTGPDASLWVDGTTNLFVQGAAGIARVDTKLRTSRNVVVTPAQITANQNNYAIGTANVLRLSSDAARNITGIVNGGSPTEDGRELLIINVGAQDIVLTNEDAASTAINRIITGTGASVTLATLASARLIYDVTSARWRIVA